MGISLFDFYRLTPRQFQNLFEGYSERRESDFRERWEQVRWLSFYAAAGNLKRGTTPDKLLDFPWEKKVGDVVLPTQEEIKQAQDYWELIDKKRGETGN